MDDGLGPSFVERLEEWVSDEGIEGIEFESNYQLNIEDAEAIRDKDLVIFADASTEDISDFMLKPVDETAKVAFTTHSASPGYIVKLCREIFQSTPAVYILHLKGYQWDFREGITSAARENLEKAISMIKPLLKKPEELIRAFKDKS
ncbi:MAG: hypothetical protein JW861_12680 [Bacteroidales bacterium]|nr:hypothetical protein [Bacteroidales bacterium]